MKRDERLVPLSMEHHHALVLSLRIERELDGTTDERIAELHATALRFWSKGLIPHFGAEGDCLLARLVRHVAPDHAEASRLQRDHLHLAALSADLRDADRVETQTAALREFGTYLKTHVRWEEDTFFPFLEAQLTDAELTAAAAEIDSYLPDEMVTVDLPFRQ